VRGEGEKKKTKVRKTTGEVRKTKIEIGGQRSLRRLVKQDMLRCEKRLVKKKTEKGK